MDIKKIFVSKRGGIGDVILATPILRALKKRYPDSTITLMVLPNAREIVQGLSYVDTVCLYDKRIIPTIGTIRHIWRYDLAILLDTSYRPALMSKIAQIPIRIGVKHKRGSILTHPVEEDPLLDTIYEPYNLANILKSGIGLDLTHEDLTTLEVSQTTQRDKAYVENLLNEHGIHRQPFVAIAPFTAFKPKDWPLENYRKLIEKIGCQYNLPVVLLGSSQEREKVNDFNAANLLGQTTFMQMTEIIRRATLLVGSCSGHTHAAAAVNTPTVVLYGPSSRSRWEPQKNAVAVSLDLPCSPCWTQNRVCDENRCMRELSVEKVLEAIDLALSKYCH